MANPKKLTIMFYFASDNPLAPIVVSQLKAITSAGFHQNANVVCQFDPHTIGTDTHIFDVNMVNKLIQKNKYPHKRYKFWGANDPYIRNLVFDKLWSESDEFPNGRGIRESLAEILLKKHSGLVYAPPDPKAILTAKHKPNAKEVIATDTGEADKNSKSDAETSDAGIGTETELGPKKSLANFLEFCAEAYPAERYMLFVLGHGLVVGNDMFLQDEHGTESSLSLMNFAEVLKKFTELPNGKKFELISLHSCSLSAIEVAYELRNVATYMLASQGLTFVGSWPYREILMRVFNDLIKNEKWEATPTAERGDEPPAVQDTVAKIFEYVLRYSYDFQLAGYSFDLCLSDLREVDQITKPLKELAISLTESLVASDEFVKNAILTAHWEAQSFWQESYTDLHDFCSCLKRRCESMANSSSEAASVLNVIATQCKAVIAVLENDVKRGGSLKRHEDGGRGPIIKAAAAGPLYQYSHGLSLYFPWSEPNNNFFWNGEHSEYKTKYAFKETEWAKFLQTYFDSTQRKPIWVEIENEFGKDAIPPQLPEEQILEEITCKVFNEDGPLSHLGPGDGKGGPGGALGPGKGGPGGALATGDTKGGPGSGLSKGGPGGGQGGDCDCPSFKNYPSFMHDRPGGVYKKRKDPAKPTSPEFFRFLLGL